jgi:putative FmdB family regulatory protein
MPVYGGYCDTCNRNFDYISTIHLRNTSPDCPFCGGEQTRRDIKYELSTCTNFDETCKEHERWSWAMGVNVEQIPEAIKAFPGSEYNPKTGQLRVKSRAHKLQEMKRRGMEEYV